MVAGKLDKASLDQCYQYRFSTRTSNFYLMSVNYKFRQYETNPLTTDRVSQ